jgi:hypothetical protein
VQWLLGIKKPAVSCPKNRKGIPEHYGVLENVPKQFLNFVRVFWGQNCKRQEL